MKLPIRSSSFDYEVEIGRGSLLKAAESLDLNRKVMVVSDENIPDSYIDMVRYPAKESFLYRIKPGEASKSFEELQKILSFMLQNGFARKDCVVAIGGGVVGDLAGFASSIYMRGVDFYNIPTSLLAMVDSSIGGKTAIDFEGVKNPVGSFYPPKMVIVDPETLRTLPERELHAGLAESIKMAATFDADLFAYLEKENRRLLDYEKIIEGSLRIKKRVVEEDEKEKGLRKALNFGHSFGHAIEAISEGKYLHGEAVSMGMVILSEGEAKTRLEKVLSKYDLPTHYEGDGKSLISFLENDKKSDGDHIDLIVCKEIGKFSIVPTKFKDLDKYLAR